jgi:hypothetical protein
MAQKLSTIKIFFAICFIFMSCNRVNYYPVDQIEIKQVQKTDGGILIIYSVFMETMYSSSGADVTYNLDSSNAKVYFVKQRIETHTSPALESHYVEPEDSLRHDVFIVLPKKVKRIQLGDSEKIIAVN